MNESLSTSAARDYLLKKAGKTFTTRTIRRWWTRGILDRSGSPIRLQSRVIGGRRFTTAQWLDEFLEALNAEPEWMESTPTPRHCGPVVMTPAKQRLQDEFGFNYGPKRKQKSVSGVQREG